MPPLSVDQRKKLMQLVIGVVVLVAGYFGYMVTVAPSPDSPPQLAAATHAAQTRTPKTTPPPTTLPTPSPDPGNIPPCLTHNPIQWHALISVDGTCHYDHQHGHFYAEDCAAELGEPGAWFGQPGQSVSYPWQTPDENKFKHEAYMWVVRCDAPNYNNEKNWIVAFRTQGHVDTMPFFMAETGQWMGGYLGNQHSASVEAKGCNETGCGIVRFGGWFNYGRLEIDEGNCILLPGDPEGFPCGSGPGGRRVHFECLIPNLESCPFFWYGEPDQTLDPPGQEALHPVVLSFASKDATAAVRMDTLFTPDKAMICPDMQCEFNGSTISQHVLSFNVNGKVFDPDGDGFVTGVWFTDRYGRIVDFCMAVSLDCIPLIFDHFPPGYYEYRDDAAFGFNSGGARDFDISPDGSFWITWPLRFFSEGH